MVILIGFTVGLLGIFYRNILKGDNMILNPLYKGVFVRMVKKGGFLRWIAYPLGYCIYCSTFWIGVLSFWIWYKTIDASLAVVIGVSHTTVDLYCRYVLKSPLQETKPDKENLSKRLEDMDGEEFEKYMHSLKS